MKRWQHFITSLALDQRVDFEEGDIGLPGGAEGVAQWEKFRGQFGAQRFIQIALALHLSGAQWICGPGRWPQESAEPHQFVLLVGGEGNIQNLSDV